MSGKGSKRRPIDPKLERKVFEDNWDRIFNKNKKDLSYESDNPLERPYEPTEWWTHYCGPHQGVVSVEKGSLCNWCALREEDYLAKEAAKSK